MNGNPTEKFIPDHFSFIFLGALVGAADSLWPYRKAATMQCNANE
jgi:hypothetical protein